MSITLQSYNVPHNGTANSEIRKHLLNTKQINKSSKIIKTCLLSTTEPSVVLLTYSCRYEQHTDNNTSYKWQIIQFVKQSMNFNLTAFEMLQGLANLIKNSYKCTTVHSASDPTYLPCSRLLLLLQYYKRRLWCRV